ncbi:MAG: hypothetical protein LBT46_05910 [Planctomycetaceae bacterium]|nr:hypothetical protein [Planctomycetaceae bacterium]
MKKRTRSFTVPASRYFFDRFEYNRRMNAVKIKAHPSVTKTVRVTLLIPPEGRG